MRPTSRRRVAALRSSGIRGHTSVRRGSVLSATDVVARAGGYRLIIMPNDPSERTRAAREPHARPRAPHGPRLADRIASSHVRSGPPRRGGDGATGALKTPAGAGLAVVAAVAVLLALSGLLGSANRNPGSIAVAGGTLPPAASSPVDSLVGASPDAVPPSSTPDAPAPSATPLVTPAPTV